MSVSDGRLSPRRESRQSAAETPSVSAFPHKKQPDFVYVRHDLIEMANLLPRSAAPAVQTIKLCLSIGVPCVSGDVCTAKPLQQQGTPKQRHKNFINNRVAGERGKRSAFPGGCAEMKNYSLITRPRKTGIHKGIPLMWRFGDFFATKKSPAGGRTR